MKTSFYNPSSRECTKTFEIEKAKFTNNKSASGKTEFCESEYTIIEKDLNESSEKNEIIKKENYKIEEAIINPTAFEKLLETMETDIDFYQCFKLTQDQSVYLFF